MQTDKSFKHYLTYSQIAIYAAFLICIALEPTSLGANSGLSYFGVHRSTIVPFGFGMLLGSYFIMRASHYLTTMTTAARWLNLALRGIALLIVGIVITPYSLGGWFDVAHRSFGITLFSLQLLVSLWMIIINRRAWLINYGLLALQMIGGLISLVYLNPTHGYLIQGQLLFQMAFSAILMISLDRFKYQDT